jgi:hypothetical protein
MVYGSHGFPLGGDFLLFHTCLDMGYKLPKLNRENAMENAE